MHQIGIFSGKIVMSRPFRFRLIIASALILLSADVRAQNATNEARGNSPARAVIGPIRGVDYGPYRNDEKPGGSCPTSAEIDQDLPILATMGNVVRVFSVVHVPCNLDDIVRKVLAYGLKAIPSAFLCGGCAANQTEINDLITLLKSLSADDLTKIPFVVVGSESLSMPNPISYQQLTDFIAQVRAQVPGVKVTTAEIYYHYLANGNQPCLRNGFTDLGNLVDVIFFNIHPYQENVPLDQAVKCILDVHSSLNSAYPQGKPIVISETGWPSVTSVNDQQTFWQSFITAARQNNIEYFGFEAFDEPWKSTPLETSWGLWDRNHQPKVPCGIVSFTPPIAGHDFNGNGKSDIAWRDMSGNVAIWLMNGKQICGSAVLDMVPTVWSIVGTGDFNGDGKYDLLWRDASGNVGMWFMNGTQTSGSAVLGNISTAWSIVGIGDFNGDGKGDILWRDTSGNVAIWLMNGAQVLQSAVVANVPTNWSIVGTGDFNGDGKGDILWRDTSGNVAIWLMNDAQVLQSVVVANVPTAWSISETGDFNGDGKSDILWRDTSGNIGMWFMNGVQASSSVIVGTVGLDWTIQSRNVD